MAHDEFDMVLSSKAIAETGSDLSGSPFPFFFVKSDMEARQTNVLPFLLSPYFKLVDVNLFTARVPFVLINLLLGVGIVKLVTLFIKDKKGYLSLLLFVVFLFSPWNFDFGRRAFAAPTSLMFLTWGLYFLFHKKQRLFATFVSFFLATFIYMGSVVLVPPILLLSVLLKFYFQKQKDFRVLRNNIGIFLIIAISVVGYIFLSSHIEGGIIANRGSEASFQKIEKLTPLVNEARRQSIRYPYKKIVSNKITVYLGEFAKDYINVFNVESLFFSGDPRFTYTFEDHGLLMLIGFPLLLIGIAIAHKKSKKITCLLGSIALIAPLGPAISGVLYTYIYRAYPLMLVYVIIISLGTWHVINTHKAMRYILPIIYLAFFINFLIFYSTKLIVKNGENYDILERTVSNVILREVQKGNQVTIAANIPYHIAKQVNFYDSSPSVWNVPYLSSYKLSQISIINTCDYGDSWDVLIVDTNLECEEPNQEHIIIQQQKDSGYRYKIYGSTICSDVELQNYKRYFTFGDYNMEELSDSVFCRKWLFDNI